MSTANLDLAVIGNGQVAALVDDRGRIVWACLPKPDADFCRRFRSRGRNFRPIVKVRRRPQCDNGAAEPQRVAGSHHIRFLSPALNYRITTNGSLSSLLDESAFVLGTPLAYILASDETIDAPCA